MSPAKVETPRLRLSPALNGLLDTLDPANRTATLHAVALLGAASVGLDLSTLADEVERVIRSPQLHLTLVAALTTLHDTLGGATTAPVPIPASLKKPAAKASTRRTRNTTPPRETHDSGIVATVAPGEVPNVGVVDALVAAPDVETPTVLVAAIEPAAPPVPAFDDDFDLGFTV